MFTQRARCTYSLMLFVDLFVYFVQNSERKCKAILFPRKTDYMYLICVDVLRGEESHTNRFQITLSILLVFNSLNVSFEKFMSSMLLKYIEARLVKGINIE